MLNFNFRFLIYFSLIISSILSVGCGYSEEQFLAEVNKANENKRLAEEREARIGEQEKKIEAATNSAKELDEELQEAKNALNNMEEETRSRDQRLASLESGNKWLKKKVKAKESSNAKLRAQIEESQNENSNKQIQNYKNKIKTMTEMHAQELKAQKELFDSIREQLESDKVKITSLADRIAVRLDERLLFKSGTAFIKADGFKILDKIGAVLKKVQGKHIQIEGHTDNRNIKGVLKQKFATNWELSVARAISVTRYFIDVVKVDPKKLSATGFGSQQPISDNTTPEGQSINRRVEFALLPIRNNKVE